MNQQSRYNILPSNDQSTATDMDVARMVTIIERVRQFGIELQLLKDAQDLAAKMANGLELTAPSAPEGE